MKKFLLKRYIYGTLPRGNQEGDGMMEAFVESGMTFGPFDDSQIFRIEKSRMLEHCSGVKSVEFIYRKKKYVLIINGHEETWLPPLIEDLRRKTRCFHEIWNSELVVMNDKIARETHLIT